MSRDAQVASVTSQINNLLTELNATVAALTEILGDPKIPKDDDDAEEDQWPVTS